MRVHSCPSLRLLILVLMAVLLLLGADAILIVLDAGKEGLNRHREILERELETVGIRLNQKENFPSVVVLTAAALVMVFSVTGCQSQSNPWVGEPYQDPITYRSPPQSIYAPMPIDMPSIEGTAMETDETLEAELDLLREPD